MAVYIEDAAGKVLRHLAAGALGNCAPAPLKPGSLKQSIAWDGKDDDGRQVQAGKGLQVRVGLGLKASPRDRRALRSDLLRDVRDLPPEGVDFRASVWATRTWP